MADMSGRIIFAVMIYYIFFFIFITGLLNVQAEVRSSYDYNVTFSNPGFDTTAASLAYSGNISNGYCSGESESYTRYFNIDFADAIFCEDLVLNYNNNNLVDPEQCNNIINCSAENKTSWFGLIVTNITECKGEVNQSYYNISNYTSSTICTSPTFIYNKINCEIFGCEWSNVSISSTTGQYSSSCNGFWDCATDIIKSIFSGIGQFFSTITWVITFKADVGLGSFNWLFSLIFFYIPFILLMYGIATIWK